MNAGSTEENGNWHGQIPSDWRVQKLKRVFSGIDYGISESTSGEGSFQVLKMGNIVAGEIAFTNIEFVQDVDANLLLRPHDLLFNRTNSLDQVAKVGIFRGHSEGNVTFASYLVRLRTSPRNHPNYINYVLNDEGFIGLARKLAIPSVQQANLNPTRYGRMEVPLPALPEQKRIAAYLDVSCAAIDRAVETKQKQLETLDALRKSIIQRAVTQGLNPEVKMKDSGTVHLGPVPQHWKVRRAKDVFEFHNHRRIPISSAERGVMNDRIYDYYGASGAIDKVENYIFEGRYILLAEDGANLLTRSKQLAFFAEGKFWVNNHAHVVKPWRGNEVYWVNLLESQDYSLAVTGSAQPKLNMQNFGRFQIPVPPVDEQNEIADFVIRRSADCDKVIDTLSAQIVTLTAYRKSLIHECVTGRRRISETDVAKVKAHV